MLLSTKPFCSCVHVPAGVDQAHRHFVDTKEIVETKSYFLHNLPPRVSRPVSVRTRSAYLKLSHIGI